MPDSAEFHQRPLCMAALVAWEVAGIPTLDFGPLATPVPADNEVERLGMLLLRKCTEQEVKSTTLLMRNPTPRPGPNSTQTLENTHSSNVFCHSFSRALVSLPAH